MSRWLVTGGAGFIGTNLVAHLASRQCEVVVVDDLSRPGVERNVPHLQRMAGVTFCKQDITDRRRLWELLEAKGRFGAVAHLAGQVSLLASLQDPVRDFEVNALGAVNLLEYFRKHDRDVPIIGLSSNKVYGDLAWVETFETEKRYVASEFLEGFGEDCPLDFGGPYGCSKGAMDQYFGDYSRSYGMRTVSLRQSSVYGPHQHPRFDQGWVSFLIHEALAGRAIQLSGVGKQVRDLLHVSDLCRLISELPGAIVPGKVHQWNCGGGVANSLSILELFDWLVEHARLEVRYDTGPLRPGDQKIFMSDNISLTHATGWRPFKDIDSGLSELVAEAS